MSTGKFSGSMKLAELIGMNWKLLSVLSRLNIGLEIGRAHV